MKMDLVESKNKPRFAVTEGNVIGGKGRKDEVIVGFQPANRYSFLSEDIAKEICTIGMLKRKIKIDGKEIETKGSCSITVMLDSKKGVLASCQVIDSSLLKGGVKALLGNPIIDGYGLKVKDTNQGKILDASGYKNLL